VKSKIKAVINAIHNVLLRSGFSCQMQVAAIILGELLNGREKIR